MAHDYATRGRRARDESLSAAIVAQGRKSRYSGFMSTLRNLAPRDPFLSRVFPTAILGGLLLRPARR
jgi:hypothetical protein